MAVDRDQLLDSALQIVARDGFASLTLDAVAKTAGVSKGGLIHHFPSKEALVAGMLEHHCDQLERELDRRAADDPLMTGRRLRAMLEIAFPWLATTTAADVPTGTVSEQSDPVRLLLAMITAAAVNRDLLNPMKTRARAMMDRMLQHDPDPDWQLMSWLIVDGLMLWQYLGLIAPSDPLFERLIRRLHAMSSHPPARPTEVPL